MKTGGALPGKSIRRGPAPRGERPGRPRGPVQALKPSPGALPLRPDRGLPRVRGGRGRTVRKTTARRHPPPDAAIPDLGGGERIPPSCRTRRGRSS
jgi:hypothetical protein